ncbi:LCP family protein [Streptomyces sp. NPDC001985]|uniref:LCP family protein n=1 Tax=Streptomyces sp. NPDC001985 TaxID=3154406 RepID=UPI00331B8F44
MEPGASGPGASGPGASGPGTSGPEADGPESKEPEANGAESKEPEANGAESSGPEANGAESSGPETSGAETSGAEAAGGSAAGGPDAPAPAPSGARPARRRRLLIRLAAGGVSLTLLAGSAAAWWFYRKLDSNITTDTTAAAELQVHEKERPAPLVMDAQNILVLGSDTRSGKGNSEYGRDDGGKRSDTTILLHIAADRQSATAMSIPRDLMAEIPGCRTADGSRTGARFAQFNSAYETGGAACTIRTVEKMTGIRVDHHMIVDFRGFKKMVDAIDGVEVCVPEAIDDPQARLRLAAGEQTLHGEEALGYVRARKSLGDGSDTERMERQQQFLGSLVKKVQSNGVLLNPARLYPLLDAATKSLTTDPGLDSLKDLYDLTRSVRSIPTEKVQFLTAPRQPYTANTNRDELIQPDAEQLFKRLREDAPITVVPEGGRESEETKRKQDATSPSSPSPSPTFTGTNAATGSCGVKH